MGGGTKYRIAKAYSEYTSLAFRDLYELPGPGKVGIWKIKKKLK
jgi:hypothetical protein